MSLSNGPADDDDAIPARPRRMSAEERRRDIVLGSIAYFSEKGFGGQTRELAERLDISNALLFKYFPSKDLLIEAIYEELFLRRWKPIWQETIADRSVPLLTRLETFYVDYAQMLHDREWVRIFLHSGLAGAPMARRFGEMVRVRVYLPVVDEIRHVCGFAPLSRFDATEAETELVWSLHGSIVYIGIRKWVYGGAVPADIEGTVRRLVQEYHAAACKLLDENVVPRSLRKGRGERGRA